MVLLLEAGGARHDLLLRICSLFERVNARDDFLLHLYYVSSYGERD